METARTSRAQTQTKSAPAPAPSAGPSKAAVSPAGKAPLYIAAPPILLSSTTSATQQSRGQQTAIEHISPSRSPERTTKQQEASSPAALIQRAPTKTSEVSASLLPEAGQKELQKINKALQSGNFWDAWAVQDVSHATEEQKIGLIRIVLQKGGEGLIAKYKLINLWRSFGDFLSSVTDRYMPEWQQSQEKFSPGWILHFPVIKKVQNDFINDVTRIATDNLFANREYVLKRKERLGLSASTEQPLTPQEQTNLRVSIQNMAYHVWELKQAQKRLKNITVGYRPTAFSIPDNVKFDPERQPDRGVFTYGRSVPKWDDLKIAWDATAAEIARVAGKYPEIYAALASENAENELLNLARVIPEAFGSNVGQLLDRLILRIEEEQIKLNNHKTDVLDLKPIHSQLFQGRAGASKRKWYQGFDQRAAQVLLAEHKGSEEITKALLTALEVTALLVTSFATAGSLTFFLAAAIAVGTPAIQGVVDWEKAAKLEQTTKATPLPGTELVTQAQVDEKKSQAMSELIRALINAITLGVPAGIKLACLGMKTAAAEGAPRIILYRGTVYRFVKGASQNIHDLGQGVYMTTEPELAVLYAQERRAAVQALEPGAPGIVLRVETEASELGRVLDFYNDPALRESWESFVRSMPNGNALLEGRLSSEIYNAYFENWLATRGWSPTQFDVIIGPEYRLVGPQVVIRNEDLAERLLQRAEEWARAHEPVPPTSAYPENVSSLSPP